MRRQSKLKIALLTSVSFLILGFFCVTSVDPVYGSTSALLEPNPNGSAYTCCDSLARPSQTIAVANTADTFGRATPVKGSAILVQTSTKCLGADAGLLSALTFPRTIKVSANILHCVHTL